MGAQSRQYYQEQANQGLASTNAAILRGGGDANALAGSYTGYEKGLNSLAVYDDQARIANLDKLSNAYLRMSANKDKQWQVNTYGKWADTAQALAAEQAGAQQTMNAGIGIAGQGLSGLASGMSHRAPSTQTQGAAAPDPSMNMSGPQSFGKNSGGGQLPDPSMQGMSGPQTYQSGYSPTVGNYGGGWSWSGYAPAQS